MDWPNGSVAKIKENSNVSEFVLEVQSIMDTVDVLDSGYLEIPLAMR